MRRAGKDKRDLDYLRKVGKKIEETIRQKGFKSPYEFWIEACDGEISRSSLNRLIVGDIDPKLTTLRALSRLLKVKLSQFTDID